MKFRLINLIFLIVLAVLTAGCTGGSLTATSWPGMTSDGETIFLAFGPHVYALDASNGGQLWRFPAEPENKMSFFAAPVLATEDQLVVGGYDNVLYSLNPKTGQTNSWNFAEGRNLFIGSALPTSNIILAPSADGHLYALDFSGQMVWEFLTEEPQWVQPATDGNSVYLVSLDHKLYAIELQTGKYQWSVDLGGAIVGTPLVLDGVIYVGSFAKSLNAYEAVSGREIWTFPTPNWIWAGPSTDGQTIFFGDIDGTLYAVDAQTGNESWSFKADGGIFSSPLVVDGKIYFTTESGSTYAFTTEKEQLWSQKVVGKIYSSPVQVNNLLLVAFMESDKLLIAFDENGIERWNFTPIE